MEIKIKIEYDEGRGNILLTDEHLNNMNFINMIVFEGKKIKGDYTINLLELFLAVKVFIEKKIAIKEEE